MLDYVREGDILIVTEFSRLARSTTDLLNIVQKLREKGVEFVSLKEQLDTNTPQGRFMLTVFAAMAELERETIPAKAAWCRLLNPVVFIAQTCVQYILYLLSVQRKDYTPVVRRLRGPAANGWRD